MSKRRGAGGYRPLPDVTRAELLEAADLLLTMEDEMAERPAKGSSAHGRETTQPTDTELLRATIERERALAGLFNTLRDLALDARDLLRQEAHKR